MNQQTVKESDTDNKILINMISVENEKTTMNQSHMKNPLVHTYMKIN